MSDWLGANVAVDESNQHALRRSRQHQETVEAALNRLSKAYQTSMECIAAWHRADLHASCAPTAASTTTTTTTTTATTTKADLLEKLREVGRTARRTLEYAVLLDPLVLPYIPSTLRVLFVADHTKETATATATTTKYHNNKKRPPPPALTSSSHKALVRQLAYLSLVNYSDLLMAGLPRHDHHHDAHADADAVPSSSSMLVVLEKGVVAPLSVFSSTSCWEEEPKDIVRRSLAALLDASVLDGADPVVWLKLACVARRLGRISAANEAGSSCTSVALSEPQPHASDNNNNNITPTCFLKHRRLERHALEHGSVALPETVPPNRLVMKALDQWWKEQDEINHITYYHPPRVFPEEQELQNNLCVVELSRYSWSALGRILLRLCRDHHETVVEKQNPNQQQSSYSANTITTTTTTSSKRIKLQLSPLLALPSAVLARICHFLEESQIWRFEATCRALSYSILSARTTCTIIPKVATAVVDNSSSSSSGRNPSGSASQTQDTMGRTGGAAAAASSMTSHPTTDTHSTAVSAPAASAPAADEDSSNKVVVVAPTQPPAASRVSKRLQTQQMTSGRRSERKRRLSSTEFCLVAATLGGWTPESKAYRQAKASNAWEQWGKAATPAAAKTGAGTTKLESG